MATLTALSTQKNARIEARVQPEVYRLIKHAADLEGHSLTDFIISAAQLAAKRTIYDYEIVQYSQQDQRLFAEALLNPPTPNTAMLKAMKLHDNLTQPSLAKK